MGISPLRNRLVGELSGGEFQRVVLARALAGRPDLLFLDEPTTAVDAASRGALLDLLRNLCRDQNLAILVVTHEIELICRYADRIAVLDRDLLFTGAPDDAPPEWQLLIAGRSSQASQVTAAGARR
jgi:ABC-type Mn2+/Zn2+ transport system ATPase subunit